MKILIYSAHSFEKPYFNNCFKHQITMTSKSLSMKTVALSKGFQAIAVFTGDTVNDEVIQALAKNDVMFIATRSVGYNHIDLLSAYNNGIVVANVPAYSPYSVSEHAIALLLTLVRKIIPGQKLFTQQDFRLDQLVGFDLHGKTAGIIGCGKIGKNIARIMNGFGCKLIAYDSKLDIEADSFISFKPLREVLRLSDILFLSCPLNNNTHHLIGETEMLEMKKSGIIINVARGAVIDTEALVKVLESGHLSGVGLDVYEYEKGLYFHDFRNQKINKPFFKKLQRLDNVIMTSHQGFLTTEAIIGIVETTCKNLDEWESQNKSSNDLNLNIP